MKLTLVALLAAAAATLATPAAAGGYVNSLDTAVADDSYFPGETPLPIPVQEAVRARRDTGLSLAGFYNDPAAAFAHRYYAPAAYEVAPPVYGEPPQPGFEYAPEPYHGPHVIGYGYGHRRKHAYRY